MIDIGEVHVYCSATMKRSRVTMVSSDGVEVEIPDVRRVSRHVEPGVLPVVEILVRGRLVEHRPSDGDGA